MQMYVCMFGICLVWVLIITMKYTALPALYNDLNNECIDPSWEVVVRDDDYVKERLKHGECDGLLADCWLEPDDLLHFALDMGAFDVFATLPDPRQRRNIPSTLFGKVLLAGTIPDLPSLRKIGATIFNSAVVLDQLGVNFYATRDGGSRTGDERPFDVEALGDYLAALTLQDYTTHALTLAGWLRMQEYLEGTTWAIDCIDVCLPKGRVPLGKVAETQHIKLAVLSVITASGVALPLLWGFGTPFDADIMLAKPLWLSAISLWGHGACNELLVDAGFIDGEWLAQLHAQGTTVITRIREKMDPLTAAKEYIDAHPNKIWRKTAVPKRPNGHERPVLREITGFTDWPGWEKYGQDLALCVVRDTYANGNIDIWCLMSTDPTISALAIYDSFRRRWQLEELFMALSRYHGLNSIPASRIGVGCARVHALFFAYTLRWLCRHKAEQQQEANGSKPWRRRTNKLIIYAGGAFAILQPSVILEIVLTHSEVWVTRKKEILSAIRYCEGSDQ
jgi:hypothetical protein